MWDSAFSISYALRTPGPALASMLISYAKFGDLDLWRRWCQWLDTRALLPHLHKVCMDDSIRFLDEIMRTDEFVEAGVCDSNQARHSYGELLTNVYRRLVRVRKDASRTWLRRAPLTSPCKFQRMPRTLHRVLKQPINVDHWLDARDNALIVMATRLGLTQGEIADLCFHAIDFRSTGDAIIEVRNQLDSKKSRWLYADTTMTQILGQWVDITSEMYPTTRRYLAHVFGAHYGGSGYQLNAGRVLQWLHAITFNRAVQNNLPFEPFHPQALRIERARELITAGSPDAMVAEYLGLTRMNAVTLRKLVELGV